MARAAHPSTSLRRLNLNLLYALEAILNTRSLTEAGRRVLISQPAMSASLRKLREQFDDELVVYVVGERLLTPLAETLRPRVSRLIAELDETFHLRLGFDPATARRSFRIAAPEAIEITLLGQVARRLLSDAPGVTICLLPLDEVDPARSFEQGADLIVMPARLEDRRFPARVLMHDGLSCMVSSDHPTIGATLSTRRFLEASHAILLDPPWSLARLDARILDLLNQRRAGAVTSRQAVLPGLLVGTDLIATGSTWLFQYYASMMPLRIVAPPFRADPEPIVAQWPAHRDADSAHDWLLNHIVAWTRLFGTDDRA